MDVWNIHRCRSEPGADRILLRFQFQNLIDKRPCALAFLCECHKALDRLEDFLQVGSISDFRRAALVVDPVALLDIGPNG